MPYGKQYDVDRAAARYRAQRDLSPDEFREWEYNVQRGNQGLPPLPKKQLAGVSAAGDERDFTKALGEKLGFESSEYKGAPQYDDSDGDGVPTRVGERGPGIYVPEGGAFSGGPITRKLAGFDTPQEARAKKYAGRFEKMKPTEMESTYRRSKGMPITPELQAQIDEDALGTKVDSVLRQADVISSKLRGRKGAPGGAPPPPGGVIGMTLAGLDAAPADSPLETAAASAPAVAFNGRGPLAPSPRPTPPRLSESGALQLPMPGDPNADEESSRVRDALLASVIPGYKPVDRRAQKEAEIKRNYEEQERELRLKKLRAEIENADPRTQYKIAMEIRELQRQEAEVAKTPQQKILEQAAMVDAQGKLKDAQTRLGGEVPLSPEQRKEQKNRQDTLRVQAKQNAQAEFEKLLQTRMPREEAAKRALKVNEALNIQGVEPLRADELTLPFVDRSIVAVRGRAAAAGQDPDKIVDTAMKKVLGDATDAEKTGRLLRDIPWSHIITTAGSGSPFTAPALAATKLLSGNAVGKDEDILAARANELVDMLERDTGGAISRDDALQLVSDRMKEKYKIDLGAFKTPAGWQLQAQPQPQLAQ